MDLLTLYWLAPVMLPFGAAGVLLCIMAWFSRPKGPFLTSEEFTALNEVIPFLETVKGNQKWDISVESCRHHAKVLKAMLDRVEYNS